MTHIAICWEKGLQWTALALATDIRRAGAAVDYMLSGKAQRQFERAKRDGANEIITVREEDCRVWRRYGRSVTGTLEEVRHYELWLADETDSLPDPPDHMLSFDPAQEFGA